MDANTQEKIKQIKESFADLGCGNSWDFGVPMPEEVKRAELNNTPTEILNKKPGHGIVFCPSEKWYYTFRDDDCGTFR